MPFLPNIAPQGPPLSNRTEVLFGIFQTGNRSNGGVESATQILERLPDLDRTVFTQKQTPMNERWRAAGCAVRLLTAPDAMTPLPSSALVRRSARSIRMALTNRHSYSWLNGRNHGVLHCNDAAAFWHLAPGARLAKRPVVYSVRDTFDTQTPSQAVVKKWRRKFDMTSRIVVLSEEMRDFYVSVLGLEPALAAKIDAIPSIVDFARFRPAFPPERAALRGELNLPLDRAVFLYVAAFNEKKGQAAFLSRTADTLRALEDKVLLVFVGDFCPSRSAYAAECQAIAARKGLQGVVRFAGAQDGVERWYRASDAVVIASRNEGLARCMLEGMAAGVPVLSFDVCSAREVLLGSQSGLVLRQGDYSGFARGLTRLAHEPQLREKMGARGAAAAAARYRAPDVAARYLTLYENILLSHLSKAAD